MSRGRAPLLAEERGSILPLALGYAVLAIALILVCANATSLYLAQKRLDALADAAALAAADGFSLVLQDGRPRALLDEPRMREQARAIVETAPGGASLVSVTSDDGISARVELATAWRPPILAPFVPDGVPLRAIATSRTALD
ncbi:pilus assembly protein TadG-related protein [Microbacterium album]|uniref:Putative Flp pilus-assembly TadG-like N-terminal domain-containing protein n=1 Tax=Microbacterium album TaxID=2053191 RepID=A0A917ML34_9MICO|nr:pilus assembly protein TadG-related protein [Microbacterium album]GGH40027.1 hypothetical protein GCM10010921_11660 [Microbacterium album]